VRPADGGFHLFRTVAGDAGQPGAVDRAVDLQIAAGDILLRKSEAMHQFGNFHGDFSSAVDDDARRACQPVYL
jgi:hypothetical protein